MVRNEKPNGLKLQEFVKKLIETDNQINQIRKGIMGVNISKEDRYKSDRYKRSVPWRYGPRLLYNTPKKEEKTDDHVESQVEKEAKAVQEEAERTQAKATEVSANATTDMNIKDEVPTKQKTKTNTHNIPTTHKFLERNFMKKISNNNGTKERIHRKVNDLKREATTEKMDLYSTVAIIVPKKKVYAVYDDSKRKITKCTHVSKEHKSHEQHLKHPFYKNTEHLDRFLDMLLDGNNSSRIFDLEVNDMFKNKKTKCKHPNIVVGPVKMIQDKTKAEQNMNYARQEVAKLKELITNTPISSKSTNKLRDDTSSVTISTTNYPMFVTKTMAPKYNIFMSILTINPEQRGPVTDDIRSILSDRKLHGRRLMQVGEDAEDTGLAYEDVQEVVHDDQIDDDVSDQQFDEIKKINDKRHIDDMVLESEELLQLHVIKPTQASAKLYNPNWKGPLPLYPNELNLLMKPYRRDNVEKLPIRNNDIPEENGEDESLFNNIDYVEEYSNNDNAIAKRAQAYSDYGVLAKEGDVIVASKKSPTQDLATTKTDQLQFDVDSYPSVKVKRSKGSNKEPLDLRVNKHRRRIGRTLQSVKNTDNDNDIEESIFSENWSNKPNNTRCIKNASLKIKSLTRYKQNKKHKNNKALLKKKVTTAKAKNTLSTILPYEKIIKNTYSDATSYDSKEKQLIDDFKSNNNHTKITGADTTLSSTNFNTRITKTPDHNYSFLGDMFQKIKVTVTSYDDLNDKVENLLQNKKTTVSANFQVKSTAVPETKTASDIFIENILSEKRNFMSTSSAPQKTNDINTDNVSKKTNDIITDDSLDKAGLTYNSKETSVPPSTNTENTRNLIFNELSYDEVTTTDNRRTNVPENFMEGEDIILVNNTNLMNNEIDFFSYLANWLGAIVGAVSNISTTTADPIIEEDSVESIERQYRTRSLKSVNNKVDNNTSENITDAPVQSTLPTNILNATTTLFDKNITFKDKETTNDEHQITEGVENRTLVKRNADTGSSFVYFSDIYEDDYGVDSPFEKTSARHKNKMFLNKQKEWIQRKVKKLNEKLHSNNKMFMVKQHSKLQKDADNWMLFNDTRIRRDSARRTRAQNPINSPVIDFNVLNSKMKEICSQAANEVQLMRKIQAHDDDTLNPSSTLMQQLAQLMSDLVDLQVKQKTCRKLPPDLQEFLLWLTAPEEKHQPLPKSVIKPFRGEFTDGDTYEVTNDYGLAGLHELEETLGYATNTANVETMKPLCVKALRSVENLMNDYEQLTSESKNKISGAKDYLNDQINFLRNQVDLDDLTNMYSTMRFKRDAKDNPKQNNARNKRKFVRHFSRKHTKTTANSFDEIQSATEQLKLTVDGTKHVTTDAKNKIKERDDIKDNERDKRNLRDVYYKAVSESNKYSTSTTTEKHRQN